MRRCVVMFLAGWCLAAAPGPTEAYLAARDRGLQAFLHPAPADDARAAGVVAALDPLIAAAVGPIAVRGFPSTGPGNVDTLSPDMGFGRLDGVRLASGTTMLLVSTGPLVEAWLKDERFWVGAARPPFGSAAFLFAALRPDAAVVPGVALPVRGGEALLFRYAQDSVGAAPPNQLAVSVRRGERVYVFVAPVRVAAVPGCTAEYSRDSAAVEGLLATYRAGGARDAALFARAMRASEEASGKAQACIGEQTRRTAAWAGLVGAAQRLVDSTGP